MLQGVAVREWWKVAVPALLVAGALCGCAAAPGPASPAAEAGAVAWVNRVTWGANQESVAIFRREGRDKFLDQQLHPVAAVLPPEVEARIASLEVHRTPLADLLGTLEQERHDVEASTDSAAKSAAARRYQRHLTALAREAAMRSLLRDAYSSNQLQEQMTWFWLNHFSVSQSKRNLRAMVGDFEERAIRPHALGKFSDLVTATMRHPAMLRYLDNERNASGHINENYARELLELHTLGVDGGYSQRDVQEVARVLTGLGVNATDHVPKLRADLAAQYVRDGPFEFNPRRHDYGDKEVLGHRIAGSGLAETDALVTMLCASPATARFISRKLAVYFVGDDPAPALVDALATTFLRSGGDIALVLDTLFHRPEFRDSLDRAFKDPVHYVISAVRAADASVVADPASMIAWLDRMGEPLYGRNTPDGYPLAQSSWASSGQLATRFDVARIMGNESVEGHADTAKGVSPAGTVYAERDVPPLSAATRDVLQQATSEPERRGLLLASPEFMRR